MNQLQETIQQMNEEGMTPPAPAPDPTPAPPPAPTPQKTPPPAPPAPTESKAGDDNTPEDPSFVKPPEGAKQPGDPGAPDNTGATPPQPSEADETAFSNRLSELTDGAVTSVEDLGELVSRYNELVEEAEKGFEPKFKDERAKLAYQILAETPGTEIDSALRTLRALNFSKEGKSAKDIMFEAYLLDPKNSDLSPMKAQEYFEADWQRRFADLDDNPLTKRQVEIEAREAEKKITDLQKGFQEAEKAPQERDERVKSAVSKAVDGFGGIKLSFSDNPQEAFNITVKDNDPELAAIHEQIMDPGKAHQEFISQFDFRTPKGYQDLVREIWEMRNHKMIRHEAYKQGVKVGRSGFVKEAANQSTPKDVAAAAGTTPKPAAKQSFYEAWADAQKR